MGSAALIVASTTVPSLFSIMVLLLMSLVFLIGWPAGTSTSVAIIYHGNGSFWRAGRRVNPLRPRPRFGKPTHVSVLRSFRWRWAHLPNPPVISFNFCSFLWRGKRRSRFLNRLLTYRNAFCRRSFGVSWSRALNLRRHEVNPGGRWRSLPWRFPKVNAFSCSSRAWCD